MIFFGQQSLRRACADFGEHHHSERNHRGFANDIIELGPEIGRTMGMIQYRDRLGGMLTYYYLEAA